MKTQMLIDLGFDCFWRITWQASFLIGLILLIHWLLRDRLSARWRFTFWWLILIRLMLPVMPESAWSIFNIARKNASENLAVTPASEIIPNFTITHSIPLKPDVSEWAGDENALDDDSAVTDSSALPAMKPLNWYQSKSFQLAVAGVWLLGVLLYGGRIVIGSIWFKYRLAHRDPIDNPELSKISEECRKTLGLKRPLVIIETPEVDCPALFGLFRPKIVVPHHFLRYSSEEWRHILLHESAHIRRNDVLLSCLLAVLQALHWFNPLVWLAFHRIKADRELACDGAVLSHLVEQERKSYGHTLIKILESLAKQKSIPALVGILEVKSLLKQRICMITHYHKPPQSAAFAVVLLVILGFACLTDAQTQKTTSNSVPISGREKLNQRESSEISTNATSVQQINRAFDLDPQAIHNSPEIRALVNLDPSPVPIEEGKSGGFARQISDIGLSNEKVISGSSASVAGISPPLLNTNKNWFNAVRQYLTRETGVDFLESANNKPIRPMYYSDGKGILFVRATQDELNRIESVIKALNKKYGRGELTRRIFKFDPNIIVKNPEFVSLNALIPHNTGYTIRLFLGEKTGINFGVDFPKYTPSRNYHFNDKTPLTVFPTQREWQKVEQSLSDLIKVNSN